jgi:hypothetical protein
MHPRSPRSAASSRQPAPLIFAVLAAAAVLAVTGCGKSSSGQDASDAKPTIVKCGLSHTAANVPIRVEITRGHVACADAMTIEHDYAKAILHGKAAGASGAGPVTVSGWNCQPYPTPEVLKTGWASRCLRTGAEILAVLPNPPS